MADLSALSAAIDQAVPALSEVGSLRAQVKTLTEAAAADQVNINDLTAKLKAAIPA